ncbi:MAG: hypothetical protein GXP61_06725 [Epsilonproteobacteria bacterium]|nr:hypothetical protein [Campylobacterota bacterium]
MKEFFELEIGYIAIALFFLVITAIVTTRSFVPRVAFKRGMITVSLFLAVLIFAHYYVTTQRMKNIAAEFESGKTILCENKERLKGSQTIIISKKAGWKLENRIFINPDFYRGFHSARCAVELRQ